MRVGVDPEAGDAFLAQQKDVMDTVQKLRLKAYGEGNLKTTEQQKVAVEEETKTIIIEPAKPEVVYVRPTILQWFMVHGRTHLPALLLLPARIRPRAALFSFGVGVAMGAAWGICVGKLQLERR